MIRNLTRIWEKNWPGIHCALRGGMPDFILSLRPRIPTVGIPAFCYHVPDHDSFEKDLIYLKSNGYGTITADALVDHLNGIVPAPVNSVVLSFDDGSAEIYRVAFPLLKKYGFRAVAFVAPFFHDRVPRRMDHARACTWDELGEMHETGVIDVQSHTLEHRLLRRWPEPVPISGVINGPRIASRTTSRNFREDFELAKDLIESRLGKICKHLCFPCYDGTADAIEAGKSVGYVGFWWGTLPGVPDNRPGDNAADHIVRVGEEFLRRLPGEGRVSLTSILTARYQQSFRRLRDFILLRPSRDR